MRRTIVRFQLILVLIAVGLVGYRFVRGTPAPEGTLVLHDLDAGSLSVRTLHVSGQPQRFAVEAVGSFDSPDARRLEAYAWIINRATREPVWQMTPARATRTRGTFAQQRDTITLGPGTYDAFFTAYGNAEDEGGGLFSTSNRWRNNHNRWKLVLKTLGDPALARSADTDLDELGPRPPGLVWSNAPVRARDAMTTLLVQRPARVRVYAVGQFRAGTEPTLSIQRVGTPQPTWELAAGDTEPTDGGAGNRQFKGEISLDAGLYEVRYNRRNPGWGNWHVNPPLDAGAWGVTLSSPDSGAVVRFAPFETVQPALAIRQPGNDEDRSVAFRVARRLPVYVYGMGEMDSRENRYDYGWIETADGVRVWEMEYDAGEHAGGAGKNRQSEGWVTLDPGLYVLRYVSDGSHAYGHFNSQAPDHPERWGIALFTEAPGALTETDVPPRRPSSTSGSDGIPAPPDTEGALVALLRTGNNQQVEEPFRLDAPTDVLIYATGEMVGAQRYDWAEILDAEGRAVWQMTEDNTEPAGGADRNRVFSGTLSLDPGRYTLRYQTDDRHAYGDFTSDEAPAYPAYWGAIVKPARD